MYPRFFQVVNKYLGIERNLQEFFFKEVQKTMKHSCSLCQLSTATPSVWTETEPPSEGERVGCYCSLRNHSLAKGRSGWRHLWTRASHTLYRLQVVTLGEQHSWQSGFFSFKWAKITCSRNRATFKRLSVCCINQLWEPPFKQFFLVPKIWVRCGEDKPSGPIGKMVQLLFYAGREQT